MNETYIIILIGLFNFSIISLLVYKIVNKTFKKYYPEQIKDRPPIKLKSLIIVLLPLVILFVGAILTRSFGKILLPFVLTIIVSLTVFIVSSYFLEEYKMKFKETGTSMRVIYTIRFIISFTFFYFFFLSLIYGFDFSKIKNLFN